MRYPHTILIGIAASLVIGSLALAADPSTITPVQLAQVPSTQGNAQTTKPLPGVMPLQPATPQLQLSNELKTLQGVERIEQRLAAMEAALKTLSGNLDVLASSTRAAHEQQQTLETRIQAQTEPRYEFPPAQRWQLVLGGSAVIDKRTGLTWQRQPNLQRIMWSQAAEVCHSAGLPPSTLNPVRGWRLPTASEIMGLTPLTQDSPFPVRPQGDSYWTSTINTSIRPYHAADGEDYPFVFRAGFSTNSSAIGAINTAPGGGSDSLGSVWCVRD